MSIAARQEISAALGHQILLDSLFGKTKHQLGRPVLFLYF